MTAVAEQIGQWLDSFTKQPAAEPWIQELREAAFQRFTELGFPTTHDEEWRFTNVARVVGQGHALPSLPHALPSPPEEAQPYLARHARYDNNAFVALNTAFLNGLS